MSIPPHSWRWYGNAGHLIVSDQCRFHLCTEIGNYLVSTVGEWYPRYKKDEEIQGGEEIGCGRKYETMVFRWKKRCDFKDCDCGMPLIVPEEIDFMPANSRKEANKNHLDICKKVASDKFE